MTKLIQGLVVVAMVLVMGKAIADTQGEVRMKELAAISAEADANGYELDATEAEEYLNSRCQAGEPCYKHGEHCFDSRTF